MSMIGFLKGKVHAFGMDYVLLDVNDVGYRINFFHPESLMVGKDMTIYTYQNVREDEISLFGFLSLQEYDLFVKLISVKGLGPKIASNILSRSTVEALINAIELGDIDYIKAMPGIGAKTASQIILDLKGKLVEPDMDLDEKLSDVSQALKQFGYRPAEIKQVLKTIEKEKGSTDELIKKALALLVK